MALVVQTARPLLERLRKVVESGSRTYFVAPDGCRGAGKSTLAHYVAREMGRAPNGHPFVTVIKGDQFYAGGSDIIWDTRSIEGKVSQAIDWRRARLLAREGKAYRDDWEQRWSAAEDHYFGVIIPQNEFDLTLE